MRLLIFSSLFLTIQAACTAGSNHCKTCSDEITCEVCDDHYYLVEARSDSPCAECHHSCLHCDGPGEKDCTECTEDKYKEGQGAKGKCLRCSLAMDNCGRCSSSSSCLWCVRPYYLDASGTCAKCNEQENCYHCRDSTRCESCAVNFYPDTTGKCVSIFLSNPIDNCIEPFYGKCLECDTDSYLEDEYTCALCTNISNCISCNGKTCTKCSTSYYLKDSTTCENTNSIANCQVVDDGGCKECEEGYYKKGNFECGQCDLSCKDCKGPAITDCSDCENTNYLNITDSAFGIGSCRPCGERNPNCEKCGLNASCTNCNTGYHQAYSEIEKMVVCRNQSDIENCMIFYVEEGCKTCGEGFYVKDSITCAKCDDFCKDCEEPGSGSCTKCDEYHYLYKEISSSTIGECRKCATLTGNDNCLTCTSDGICETCSSTFYLIPADPNDITSRETCDTCFVPCTKCDGPEFNECTNCSNTHFLKDVSSGGKTCVECAEKTANCTSCSLEGVCDGCEKGFYVTGSAKCEVCDEPCTGCKTGGNTQCTDCLDTHYLEENPGICTECSKKVANCTNCNIDGECLKCREGSYVGEDKVCRECSAKTAGCELCTVEGACTKPQNGYYMDGSSHDCYKCDSSCKTCIAEGSSGCTSCPDGYYIEPGISIGSCLRCPLGCSGCNSTKLCIGCKTNFTLVDGYCKSAVGPSLGGHLFTTAAIVLSLLIFI
eukprot:TRINITY_DN1739_c0_g1_i6.p1 TRINITY_DN1739_c0_g1~~TRINITY_DN1739_c0_g1_i6.p1  ORF type:complete len:714 (+),score=50.70 TRINITY_DN1739_c0_g1_i6:138-2279(+)